MSVSTGRRPPGPTRSFLFFLGGNWKDSQRHLQSDQIRKYSLRL